MLRHASSIFENSANIKKQVTQSKNYTNYVNDANLLGISIESCSHNLTTILHNIRQSVSSSVWHLYATVIFPNLQICNICITVCEAPFCWYMGQLINDFSGFVLHKMGAKLNA